MRFASLLVVFFAMALSASAATLPETFTPYYTPFPGGYAHGWNSTRTTQDTYNGSYSYLDWQGTPWFDPSNPWFSNWTSSTLSNNTTKYDSTTFFLDASGNAGVGPYLFDSITDSTTSYLNTTTYPLQGVTHVDGNKYNTRDTIVSMGIYSFDCRELVNAGLSGACAGSDIGSRLTTNMGLGGIWFSFDINMNDGTIFNYNRGDIGSWRYENIETWNRSWDSQAFNPTPEVPEPATYAMMGAGLVALALARRPWRTRTGLSPRSGKTYGK